MQHDSYEFDDELRRAFEAYLRRRARGRSNRAAARGATALLVTRLVTSTIPGPVGRGIALALSLLVGGLFTPKDPDIRPLEPLDPLYLTSGSPELPFGRFIGGRGVSGVGNSLARELDTLILRGY